MRTDSNVPDPSCVLSFAAGDAAERWPGATPIKLDGGKLAITYAKEAKRKPVTWVVWFDNGGKTLNTPKEKLTATERAATSERILRS